MSDQQQQTNTESPVSLWIVWGTEDVKKAENEGFSKNNATQYDFDTEAEMDAFIRGINESQGWNDFRTHFDFE